MTASRPDRLLVVGASGLVGAELVRRARALGIAVHGVARHARGEATSVLDLGDRAALEHTLAAVAPDVVAVCSAYPHVDGCEADPARSQRENVDTVAGLVAATRGAAVRLVFYSTDHVFDGRRECYVERDPVAPRSVYARDKRRAEELLLGRGRALVVRTAWVFGPELGRKNFMYQVIDAAQARRPLRVPAGQAGCPTFSGWLAESTLAVLADGLEGVVHLAGGECLTKVEWARVLQHALGLPDAEVEEVGWREAGQVAPRPERVRLASERHTRAQPALTTILATLRGEAAAA
jgi:dTDP-4-dehydrorhamnose reductase